MLRSGVPLFKLDVGWQFRSLVLSASQFQHILNDAGRTSEVFMRHSGHALSLLSGTRRGMILQDFCRKELARLHPHSKIEEPLRSTCCNGARRSASQAEYDFGMDARKVKCRSAQMSWNRAMMRWRVLFPKVKLPRSGFWDEAAFDDLYLTIFSPNSLHIIKHDLQTGVSTVGKQTESHGHQISVQGTRGQECWQTARHHILNRFLTKGCELVSSVDLSAVEVSNWLTQQIEGLRAPQDLAYQGVPLNYMAPQLRGLRIQAAAFEVDQILHPNCSFSRSCSDIDWFRGAVRVELKSGQMCYNKVQRRWRCSFQNIKCECQAARDHDLFDELWLAIYSPLGIHNLKHPGGQVRFSMTGLNQQVFGQQINVYSSRNVLDVREALDEMLQKMEAWGCQPLATILW
ncbi:unnamed protein product [Durusdinium trenchii]|uniref:YqaJ viral recombinase domain-containing protein n=1 Tax=Durusdinium trenchii TaxID=1381693 RepID=A0ABP0LV83_9DINO